MNNVVPFERKVIEKHGTGEAFCLGCNHEWVAVAPIGLDTFECPECHTMKGRFKFEYSPPAGITWTCGCTNQLFNVTKEGIFCPNCGIYQEFPKE